MSDDQALGVMLLILTFAMGGALCLPAFMHWGVETRGYRFLCFTRKGAERLAHQARTAGSRATVVRVA